MTRRKATPLGVDPKKRFEDEAEELKRKTTERKLQSMRNKSIVEMDPQVRKFCVKVAEGRTPSDAAALAGFDDPGKMAKNLMARPAVRKALNLMIERTMANSEITRADVIAGFQDAIAIARQQSESMGMIAGYREIGKMLGMYETKVKVEITGGAQEVQRQLQGMSDSQLLEMIRQRNALTIEGEAEAVDAEFEEEDGSQTA